MVEDTSNCTSTFACRHLCKDKLACKHSCCKPGAVKLSKKRTGETAISDYVDSVQRKEFTAMQAPISQSDVSMNNAMAGIPESQFRLQREASVRVPVLDRPNISNNVVGPDMSQSCKLNDVPNGIENDAFLAGSDWSDFSEQEIMNERKENYSPKKMKHSEQFIETKSQVPNILEKTTTVSHSFWDNNESRFIRGFPSNMPYDYNLYSPSCSSEVDVLDSPSTLE